MEHAAGDSVVRKNLDEPQITQFYLAHQWYHLVIKELVESVDFVPNGDWISRRLRGKVRPQQAMEALLQLEVAGYIARDPMTGKYRTCHEALETSHDLPSDVIRGHHQEMLSRAKECLFSDSVDNRQYNSLTLSVDPERLPEAKAAIIEFLRQFNQRFSDSEGLRRHVFQLNTQLFEHTDRWQFK